MPEPVYSSDLIDVEPRILPAQRGGCPRRAGRILNALWHQQRTGCQWQIPTQQAMVPFNTRCLV